uniref:type II toxin-antitoxin system RelN family antitoxin n=1 Tax=Pseudocalidococcus azoricus TaxID=3110322 RepID=UPI003899B3CE
MVDEQGNLSLHEPVPVMTQGAVRVIILYPEQTEDLEQDADDTSVEAIKASLRRALQQATTGQRIPLSQMWEGIDAE